MALVFEALCLQNVEPHGLVTAEGLFFLYSCMCMCIYMCVCVVLKSVLNPLCVHSQNPQTIVYYLDNDGPSCRLGREEDVHQRIKPKRSFIVGNESVRM